MKRLDTFPEKVVETPTKVEAPKSVLGGLKVGTRSDQSPHGVVKALAGCGKTSTGCEGLKVLFGLAPSITPSDQQQAIWDFICQSKGARSIKFVAYGKDIAAELKRRIPKVNGRDAWEASTTHAMGFYAVRKAFTINQENGIGERTDDILEKLIGKTIWEIRRQTPDLLESVRKMVSYCKQTLCGTDIDSLEEVASHYDVDIPHEEVYDLIARTVEESLTVNGVVDYDDMCWLPHVHNLRMWKNDLLVVDECLPGYTPILLADGTSKTIKEIVDNSTETWVRSYDVTHPNPLMRQKNCLVTARQRILNQKPLVKIKVRCRVQHSEGVARRKGTFVVLTVDHKVWTTNRGWVAAGNVTTKDSVIIETEAKTTQCGKITKDGRNHLSILQTGNKRGLGNKGGDPEKFNQIKGGNGRGPTLAESTMLDALNVASGGGWCLNYVVPTGGRKYGRPTHYKIDVANPGTMVAVEIDGWSHFGRKSEDDRKTEFLKSIGWEVHRFTNKQAIRQTEASVLSVFGVYCEGAYCPVIATVISVSPVEIRDNYVYDITVDDCHNFYANGILVHNCQDLNKARQELVKRASHRLILVGDEWQSIFGFAAADTESMRRMESDLSSTARGCNILPLTVTRRCGHDIVAEARKIVPTFEAHPSNCDGQVLKANYTRRKVWENGFAEWRDVPVERTYLAKVAPGDMVLCRSNAPLVSQYFTMTKNGIPAAILGRDVGSQILSTIRKMKADTVPELIKKIETWYHKEMGKELAKKHSSSIRTLSLSDRRSCLIHFCDDASSVQRVLESVNAAFTETRGATVTLSSIHRAKGSEADNVFLLQPEGSEVISSNPKLQDWERQQNRNLLYVALTRAIKTLTYVS
jgi:hypothetical protein